MRHKILLILPLLLGLLLLPALAPRAAADDEPDADAPGWSEPRGVPVAQPGETEPQSEAAAPEGEEPGEGEEAPEAPKPFVMPTESKVIAVRKHHNVPWAGNWLALEFEMAFAVVGQSGQDVGATITFYEVATQRPLRAAMRPYVDSEGNLSIYTQLVPVSADAQVFRSRLKIPYRAFPWPTKGPTYEVEARVRLMRRSPEGEFAVLDRSTTSFNVNYQKDCGAKRPFDRCRDCGPCAPWQWDWMYTWCKIWGTEMGTTPSKVPCLPGPRGTTDRHEWYEGRWATRGSSIDTFQHRIHNQTGTGR